MQIVEGTRLDLLHCLGPEEATLSLPVFAKPVSATKCFTGRVFPVLKMSVDLSQSPTKQRSSALHLLDGEHNTARLQNMGIRHCRGDDYRSLDLFRLSTHFSIEGIR
jgi:hypothetical protein